jgi:hypothetical protein
MKYLNLALALLVCITDLLVLSVAPLLGVLILPNLFACTAWAAHALEACGPDVSHSRVPQAAPITPLDPARSVSQPAPA